MKTIKNVDEFIKKNDNWKEALTKLRKTMQSTELEETTKWDAPVYTINGKNVAGLGAFKSYVGIWFFQGALLKDKKNRLYNAQEGKTQALRQWRFNSAEEMDINLIKEYLNEAIKNQKAGKEIKPVKNKSLTIPAELKKAISKNSKLKECFNELTLSKQREYTEYIIEAKREETKLTRLNKIVPMILEKKGLNDKYKNC